MANKQTIKVNGSEQYNVVVGLDILQNFKIFIRDYDTNKSIFVIDSNVNDKQSELIQNLKACFNETFDYIVPAGEESKNVNQFNQIVDFCLNEGVTRETTLIAIGGGVVGDLAGYVASSVLRGLPLVHIPTTLLAMVDSSIGGKTGINHTTGKNLIGSFYQPKGVFADIDVLDTLSDLEFICGFGEILKYGAISDPVILEILHGKNLLDLRENKNQMESIIQRCVKIKGLVVTQDTKESGHRMILNFGHTFAHAIEKVLGYGKIAHGQAVFIGMVTACYLSEEMGGNVNEALLLEHASSMQILPEHLNIDAETLIEAMQSDKKKKKNELRFVLLKQFGKPFVSIVPDIKTVIQCWEKTRLILTDAYSHS